MFNPTLCGRGAGKLSTAHSPTLPSTSANGGLGGGNPHGRRMGAGQSGLVLHACVIVNIPWQVQKMTHSPLLL